jgi:hypothetical protein
MNEAADMLDFETAIALRDRIAALREMSASRAGGKAGAGAPSLSEHPDFGTIKKQNKRRK